MMNAQELKDKISHLGIKRYFVYAVGMIAFNMLLLLVLSPQVSISTEEIVLEPSLQLLIIIPITLFLEELCLRYVPYRLLGILKNYKHFVSILLVVFFVISGLAHLTNITDFSSAFEVSKYFLIHGLNGSIIGYIFLKHKIVGSYIVHLIYDGILLAILFAGVMI